MMVVLCMSKNLSVGGHSNETPADVYVYLLGSQTGRSMCSEKMFQRKLIIPHSCTLICIGIYLVHVFA